MGELFALLAALTWALAVICFRKSGETISPIPLNLFKNLLGIVLILPTMAILGEAFLYPAPPRDIVLLLVSGALGIGLSDTMFFKSLNMIGAGMSAIVDCFYSPFIISLSMLLLGERLTALQIIGAVLIVSAVFAATFEKRNDAISRRNLIWGILWGVGAMATVALGIVIIKPILGHLPILWSAQVRFIGGCLVLVVMVFLRPHRMRILEMRRFAHGWKFMLVGSILGSYGALIFWLAGMKYTQASLAAALNQTSNLFVFIFAAILLKELINLQRVIGIVLGAGGVVLVMLG